MQSLLETLVDKNRISARLADKAKQQFSLFCKDELVVEQMKSYTNEVLDAFYFRLLQTCSADTNELWQVVKKVLILSHANASVESGFSLNKDTIVENLLEESLVSQRMVYDAVSQAGGPLSVPITPDLMKSVRGARSKYRDALEKKRCAVKSEENSRKRKSDAQQALFELQSK